METRNKQTEGGSSTWCGTDRRYHTSFQKEVDAWEESRKKELHERNKVEAESLREKQEQVRKRGTGGSTHFARLPT